MKVPRSSWKPLRYLAWLVALVALVSTGAYVALFIGIPWIVFDQRTRMVGAVAIISIAAALALFAFSRPVGPDPFESERWDE